MTRSLEAVLDGATDWLDASRFESGTPDEALAEALWWVAVVNDGWTAEQGALTDDVAEKLRKWLERLVEKVRQLAKDAGVQSWSVTVGTSVSLSVTFGPD